MRKWLKEFVHNCIVHPAMMFLPTDKATYLHDKNADWAFGKDSRYDELELEKGELHQYGLNKTEEELKEISRQNLKGDFSNLDLDDPSREIKDEIQLIETTDDIGYFFIDRMEEALNGNEREIPEGLTKNQLREFIIFSDEIPEDIEHEELVEILNDKIKQAEREEYTFDFDIEAIEQAMKEELHILPEFNSFEEFDEWLNNEEAIMKLKEFKDSLKTKKDDKNEK